MGLPQLIVTESNQPVATSPQGTLGAGLCVGVASQTANPALFDVVTGYGNQNSLGTALGTGELVEAAALTLQAAGAGYTGGGLVYAGQIFSGSYGANSGTGAFAVTIAGNPVGPGTVQALITTAGALGTMKFQVSTDGGVTYGPIISSVGAGPFSYLIPNTGTSADGTTLTFPADSYVGASTYIYIVTQAAGSVGSVVQTGVGVGTLTIAGSGPWDAYQIIIQIITTGTQATATFSYSLDGGQTYSQPIAASASALGLGGSGVTVAFVGAGAGAFVAGDLYAYACQPPTYGIADLVNFFNLNGGSNQQPWEFIWVVGECGTTPGNVDSGSSGPAAFAAVISAMDSITGAGGLFAGGIQPTLAVVEAPSDTTQNNIDAALASATVAIATDFVCPCAGDIRVTSPLSGTNIQRGAAWAVAPRMAQVRPGHHLGKVADGPCINVTSILRDESATPALDAARISSMRTLPRLPGFFITRGRMMSSPNSAFWQVQFRRVMNEVVRAVVPVAMNLLNGDFRVTPTGTIDPRDAKTINSAMTSAANQAAVVTKDATAAAAAVDQTIDLETTDEISVVISITPKGYAETISLLVGFSNLAT